MKKYFLLSCFAICLTIQFCVAQNNGFTTVELPTQFKPPGLHIAALDNNKNLWLLKNKKALVKYSIQNQQWTVYDSTICPIVNLGVKDIVFDNQNNLWALSAKNGLYKFDGSTWFHYDSLNGGLTTNLILCLSIQNNTLWIGTSSGALYGTPGNWNVFNKFNSGIAGDTISKIIIDDTKNRVWFRSDYNFGLSEYNNGNWKQLDTIPDVNYFYADNMVCDNGLLYFTIGQYQLYTYDGVSVVRNFYIDEPDLVHLNNYVYFKNAIDGQIYAIGNYLVIADSLHRNPYFDARFKLSTMVVLNNKIYFAYKDSLYIFDPSLYMQPLVDNIFNPGQIGKYLNKGKVKTAILNNGTNNWDMNNAQYEVPKGSDKHAIYNTGLWIGGLDDNNNIHIAAQTYRQTGVDYWAGPLDTTNAFIDSATSASYNYVWKIDGYDVEEFKHMYANGQVQNGNYIIPTDILTWPAQGIKNKAKNLAPFIDTNNDGKYDPTDGDYPKIKGDQMLWYILNDNLAPHTESNGGNPLGVEIHCSAYAYNCDTLPDSLDVINTTTFYEYKFINRSDTNYHDVYTGLYTDVDLGFATDDFIGCDSTNNIAFGYNGDNFDDGGFGYGANPPMINIQVLQGPNPSLNDGKDNNHNGLVDEQNERCMMEHVMYICGFFICENPYSVTDYYRYMKGEWLDGRHLTYGEDGMSLTNPPTNFMYSGTPYDSTGWTEINENHAPEDRRFMLSSGPVNLPAHSEQTFEYAIVYTREPNAPNGLHTSVARNIADVQKIKYWYDNNSFPSCNKYEFPVFPSQIPPLDSGLIIFPNPAIYNFTLNINDDFLNASTIKVYNALGQKIYDKNISTKTINIETWHRGLYFVVVEKEGELYKGRFLKW